MLSEIADALESEGIIDAFPIQALAVPIGLSGHDIIGQARTGTGKTLAFGIPLLQRITHGGKAPQALVVAPTRELAIQVTDDLIIAGGKLGSRVLSIYGGRAYEPQIEALRDGVDVVVGTPGRLLDMVKQKHLDLSQVEILVLDEADRMLDLGFLPDIERIVERIPAQRQTMLFSATMPGEIVALSRRYLTRPTNIRAESHTESEAAPEVVQHVFQAHQMDKPEMLARLLQAEGRGLTMVFCQTKRTCDRVAADLATRGFAAAAVHGDLGQGQRERALRAFRAGKIDVLVATDVAARGLDVDDVTHVVNYECPDSADTYVHRIGRTGRAGKEGISVTLVDWADLTRWKLINGTLDLPFGTPEETYSTSEHFYEVMGIPAGTTGTLPKANRERAGLAAEELEDIGETGKTRSRGERAPERDRDRDTERPKARKRNRQRTRTRAGRPLEAEDAQNAQDTQTAQDAPAAHVAEAPATKTRTTRTRTAKAQVEAAPDTGGPIETAPVTRTRTRTRAAKAATTQAPAAEAQIEAAPAAEVRTTRTRTRKAAATTAQVEVAPATDGPVETAPVALSRAAKAQVIVPPTDAVSGVPVTTFQAPEGVPPTEAVMDVMAAERKHNSGRRRTRGGKPTGNMGGASRSA